jgi:hypothetical protein
MSVSSLEQFIKKYQTAKNYNSKEIRLTIQEAEDLSTAISLVLSSTTVLQTKIIQLQEQLLQGNTEINVSGGEFR